MRNCEVCGIDITDKKATARTCSPKCRKELSRLESVTLNVTLSEEPVTLEVLFKFTIKQRPGSKPGDENWNEAKQKTRTEKYWYDVPLAAVPILQKGWKKMPEDMNGRQYFLWWKNEFKTKEVEKIDKETGEVTTFELPEILSPFPLRTDVKTELGGETARRWGA